MNSSIAALMIAPRRSAARSARLEAGFSAGFRALLVGGFVISKI
jgi:hypothetical protein